MSQQPQESASAPETAADEVQPPQEPKARPPRRRRLMLILSALAILLLVGVSLGGYLVITHAQRPRSPTTKTLAERWHVVDSPIIGKDSTYLSQVAASSPDDAWAWGETVNTSPGQFGYTGTPLLLHWDGQSWKTMTLPHDQRTSLSIGGITALSPDNAWLVGGAFVETGPDSVPGSPCLIMHWDGHQWRQIPTPPVQHQLCNLESITALSATDIWAAGSTSDFFPVSPTLETVVSQTLIEHWDGQQWSVVPAPSPGADRMLTQVTASAANDVWAIGRFRQQVPTGQLQLASTDWQALIEHWDGQQWSVVQSPSPGTEFLSGITALAPNDVWALAQDGGQTRTMHWDGQSWTNPTPPGHPLESSLMAVAALGPDDIWAVGSYMESGAPTIDPTVSVHSSQMLIEHWDGKQWSIVAVQAPGQGSTLNGLARVPNTGQLWAVGGWSQSSDLTTPATTLTLLMD